MEKYASTMSSVKSEQSVTFVKVFFECSLRVSKDLVT